MLNRKGAVSMAVMAAVAATASVALADSKTPTLSLEPTVATLADAPAPRAPLMAGLDRMGAAKTLDNYGLNIYGWVEAGYTYNHQHQNRDSSNHVGAVDGLPPEKVGNFVTAAPFNHEAGDNVMFNQLVLRFEKAVDTSKVDVGGMIEIMYGEDAAGIHASGLGYNGSDATDDGVPADNEDSRFHPKYQFDIFQAYVDVAVGVKGLKFRAGKFVTLLGYEYIDPNLNPFYSHSYISQFTPSTQTGLLAYYQMNDQWSFIGGVTRGWDIATEDNNGCSVDFLGQVAYTPNKTWNLVVNTSVGPENVGDSSHYRLVLDPILTWNVTDRLSLAVEGYWMYDGGLLGFAPAGVSHAYGDVWGAAAYASYVINDYVTVNGRIEKLHTDIGAVDINDNVNLYEGTLGLTIKPFPKDQWGSGLKIRPEVRYDYSDNSYGVFFNKHDQLTFAVDVIYAF